MCSSDLLAAAGAHHPDLNLKNVLLAPDADGDDEGWVLDVDVVRFASRHVTPGTAWAVGAENYERLARSLRKWRDLRGLSVSDLELELLLQLARRGADAEIAVQWRPKNAAAHAS